MTNESGKRRGIRTIVGTWIGVVATIGPYTLLSIFLAPISARYGINLGQASLIYTFAGVGSLVANVFVGGFMDKYNPKFSYLIAAVATLLFYLTLSFSTNLTLLYIMAVFFGVGSILGGYTAGQVLITKWVSNGRGTMMSLATVVMGAFIIVMSPLVTNLISRLGVSATALLIGVLCFGLCVFSALFLISRAPEYYGETPFSIGKEKPSAVKKTSDVDIALPLNRILMTPTFYVTVVCSFFITCAMMLYTSNAIPLNLTLGLSEMDAAFVFSIFNLLQIVLVMLFGILVDKIGPSASIIIWCGAGGFLFLINGYVSGLTGAILVSIAASTGNIAGMHGAVLFPKLYGLKNSSNLIGYAHVLCSLGAMTGPPLAGFIYTGTGSYWMALMIAGAFMTLSLVFTSIANGKRSREAIKTADEKYRSKKVCSSTKNSEEGIL